MRVLKLLSILAIVALLGCGEEDSGVSWKSDITQIIDAFNQAGPWSTEKIIDELIGQWDWKRDRCASFNGIDKSETRYKGFSVRFKADETAEIFENDQLVHTMTWIIDGSDAYFGMAVFPSIESIPFTYTLGGLFYVVDDVLVFSALPVDGCDSFLARK